MRYITVSDAGVVLQCMFCKDEVLCPNTDGGGVSLEPAEGWVVDSGIVLCPTCFFLARETWPSRGSEVKCLEQKQ